MMGTNAPLTVTVVTPSFNQGAFIAETIESVLGQDYPHLEYIIIDGGSTDNTLSIIRRYEADPRLSWLSEPDRGMAHALNKGFARSRGEIMGWLNSDDVYIGQPISATIDYFLRHPQVIIVYGNVIDTAEDGTPTGRMMGEPFDLIKTLSDRTPIPQPGAFWRRALWEKIGGLREDLHYAMDIEYWIRASRQGELHFVPGIRATYRHHPTSKTVSQDPLAWVERRKIAEELLNQPKEFPELGGHRRLIQSNLDLGMAQALLRGGDREGARSFAARALLKSPLRRRLPYLLLFYLDTWLGTHTSESLSHAWRRIKGEG
jgi:glycosyltransferase involved in cell wall biosynthesis